MGKFVDLTGNRFGRLVVIKISHKKWGKIFWAAKCDCGGIATTSTQKLKSGHTKSCGCVVKEVSNENGKKAKIHGHTCGGKQSRTYSSWRAMMGRCYNKNHKDYYRYGKLGILVCDRWHDFSLFLLDMGTRPKNKTIDRINGNKGYSKSNCRWASPSEQTRNTKTCKLNQETVDRILKDERSQNEIAKCYGISQSTVSLIKRGKIWKRLL